MLKIVMVSILVSLLLVGCSDTLENASAGEENAPAEVPEEAVEPEPELELGLESEEPIDEPEPEQVKPIEESTGDYVVPGTAGLKDSGKIYVSNMFAGGEADIPITIYNGLSREKVYVLSLVNLSDKSVEEDYVSGVDYAYRWVRFDDVMRVPGNSEKTIVANLAIPGNAKVEADAWMFVIRLTEVTEEQVLIAYDSKIFVHMVE